MVKTDGEMTLGLVEETVKTFLQANGGNGDALRTPGVSPFGGEHFNGTHDGVQVVKRFALSHEHDVGQRVSLRQGINLIQNVGGGKGTDKALASRHAEGALHFASHLTTDAERGAFFVGNIDCFDKVSVCCGEKIFNRSVFRALTLDRFSRPHRIAFALQSGAHLFGEV